MVGVQMREFRHSFRANICGVGTSWVEEATAGKIGQRGWFAGYAAAGGFVPEPGQRVDQETRIGMGWVAENYLCWRLFNDLASIHDADPVGDIGVHAHIVCH